MEKFSVSTINPDITELSSIMYRLNNLPMGHIALCSHKTGFNDSISSYDRDHKGK